MDLEEKIKNTILFFIFIFFIWYFFFSLQNPCKNPVTYRLGSFDNEFDMSEKDFLEALKKGAEVWSGQDKKTVLRFDPKGEIVVNFIYDKRQQTTELNKKLEEKAKENTEVTATLKEQYEKINRDYKDKEKEYNSMLTLFKQHENEYITQVSYWNTQGGAPSDIFQSLSLKKQKLEEESLDLEKIRNEFNALANELNTFASKYNTLAYDTNKAIEIINISANKEFEEGFYDPRKREIVIYEFSSNEKLIRILAHEFGHALLIPHDQENEASIMYPLNKSKNLFLSIEDEKALALRCKTGYRFISFYNTIKEILASKRL